MSDPVSTAEIRRKAAEMLERDKQAGFGEAKPTPLVSNFPTVRQALDDKGAEHLFSMTFMSSSGGRPHIVTMQPADGWISCTCEAMLNIETRPTGCWAMQAFRRVKGIPNP
jgi:hypothetical protein